MGRKKPTTKIYKHCKTEIPYGAKIYPQYRKKQGPGGCLTATIIVVVVSLVGSCFSGSKSKEETPSNATATTIPSNNSNQKEETTAPESTVAEKTNSDVGEVVGIRGVQVSLLGTTESKGSNLLKPGEGDIFVLCEFKISNNSDKDISVNSMMGFEAYCDDYSVTQDILGLQAPRGKGGNQLDSSVAAGKKISGVIAYQVPGDWKALEIKFPPSFWSNKSATFVATKQIVSKKPLCGNTETFHIDSLLPDTPGRYDYPKQVNYIIPEASWQGAYFPYPFFRAHQNLAGCNMGYNMGRNEN